ncbi:MAG: RNA methyltransferase [Acidobacteria bacterium SCN 69-37]|nr:MAG: RNA methyltransferase [Acidobacteria bacterium SCN 69-37]
MNRLTIVRAAVVAAGLVAMSAVAFAQNTPFEPTVGQGGKDVVWVPTPDTLVEKMLDLAKVTPADSLIDLGSGDGKTVIAAAKRGVKAKGIEYNPDMVALSQRRAREAGVTNLASFERADLFETDLSTATVITMFLLPDINLKLRPKILDLKPGTRIVSNSFTMGEWEEDASARVTEDCSSWCTALLWIVPAKVQGTWQVGNETLTLAQTFQMVSGTLGSTSVSGRMNGEEITFTAGNRTYTGRVDGGSITGTISGGGSFTATRR